MVLLTPGTGTACSIAAKGKPVLHIWRKDSGDISLHASFAGRETTENPLKRTYFHPLGKQPLPEGSKALLFPVATWDEHYYKPSSRGNTESESINADPEAFGASLSPETAQAFSLPFAQDLQKEAIKRKDTGMLRREWQCNKRLKELFFTL